jgi:hypothetical protein
MDAFSIADTAKTDKKQRDTKGAWKKDKASARRNVTSCRAPVCSTSQGVEKVK